MTHNTVVEFDANLVFKSWEMLITRHWCCSLVQSPYWYY